MTFQNSLQRRLPAWLIKRGNDISKIHQIKKVLRQGGLHTVCEEARCPNLGECFGKGVATFLIMGNVCTRRCRFCNISNGVPLNLDSDEPRRVAEAVLKMGLKHVVITSVTRDDLEDGGASHFAATIKAIRSKNLACCCEFANGGRSNFFDEPMVALNDNRVSSDVTIEVLTPDFKGSAESIKVVCEAKPDVFNHNLETVERLTALLRDKASYKTSLRVLEMAKSFGGKIKLKSGIMVGMGELKEEVKKTLKDLYNVGCNIVTIGQYLQPNRTKLKVKEFVEPQVFNEYKEFGESIGIEKVFSGPFVRSSYMAERFV